jgi:hypothetical protein
MKRRARTFRTGHRLTSCPDDFPPARSPPWPLSVAGPHAADLGTLPVAGRAGCGGFRSGRVPDPCQIPFGVPGRACALRFPAGRCYACGSREPGWRAGLAELKVMGQRHRAGAALRRRPRPRILSSRGESVEEHPRARQDRRNLAARCCTIDGAGRVRCVAARGVPAGPAVPRHGLPPGRLPRAPPRAGGARPHRRAREQRRGRAGGRCGGGRVPLVLLVAGLGAYALTQLIEAVFRPALSTAGAGLGLFSVAATTLGTTVPEGLRGTASGIINTAAQLGTAVGIAALLLIADATTGAPGPGTGAPIIAWAASAALAAAGALAFTSSPQPDPATTCPAGPTATDHLIWALRHRQVDLTEIAPNGG